MHIVVGVKQAFDVDQIKIDPHTFEPIYDGLLKLDDLSKNALEEAVRIKESFGGKITVITLDGEKIGEAVKEALAIGGDEAKVVSSGGKFLDTASTAYVLAEVIKSLERVDLILFGHASIDSYTGQVGPRVAEILGLPVVTYVREIKLEDGSVIAIRDLEDCLEEVWVRLPCVLTVTNEINEPRLPSLSQILGARKKPVEEKSLSDLGLDAESDIKVIYNRAPKIERKRKIYKEDLDRAVYEIVSELTKEGVI
jgi:electron transfer flavoprotein beta subunit